MVQQNSSLDIEQLKKSVFDKFHQSTNIDQAKVGLELELFPFVKDSGGKLFPAEITNEDGCGTYDFIKQATQTDSSIFKANADETVPSFEAADGGNISYEPGGQIEYSSSSRGDLLSALNEVDENLKKIEAILKHKGISLFQGAINPWNSVDEVGLKIKKARYRAMDQYFNSIGPSGRQMMRLTAAFQVNLDFGDKQTAGKRWLAANLLSPVTTAIFGNSPFMESRHSGAKSYRSTTWQNLDNSRTGFSHLQTVFDGISQTEDQYLEFALNAAVIMLPDKSGIAGFQENSFSFQQWIKSGFNGWFPEMDDWEYHLTTLFPEVRPKGFMECRFIDGLSKAWWPVPAILLSSIIYNTSATEQIINLMLPELKNLDQMRHQASIAGVSAFPELAKQVFEIALDSEKYQNEPELMAYFERFYQNYTSLEKSPADELLSLNDGAVFTIKQYAEYDKRTLDTAQPPEFALLVDRSKG